MDKFDPKETKYYDNVVHEAEAILGMWDFFCKPPEESEDFTNQDMINLYGQIEVDDEVVTISNSGMKTVAEMFTYIKQTRERHDKERYDFQAEIKGLKRTIEQYKKWAHMCDDVFAEEELNQQIAWCDQADTTGETYGSSADTKILAIARDRLRRR